MDEYTYPVLMTTINQIIWTKVSHFLTDVMWTIIWNYVFLCKTIYADENGCVKSCDWKRKVYKYCKRTQNMQIV